MGNKSNHNTDHDNTNGLLRQMKVDIVVTRKCTNLIQSTVHVRVANHQVVSMARERGSNHSKTMGNDNSKARGSSKNGETQTSSAFGLSWVMDSASTVCRVLEFKIMLKIQNSQHSLIMYHDFRICGKACQWFGCYLKD